jgi:hypothetical protein
MYPGRKSRRLDFRGWFKDALGHIPIHVPRPEIETSRFPGFVQRRFRPYIHPCTTAGNRDVSISGSGSETLWPICLCICNHRHSDTPWLTSLSIYQCRHSSHLDVPDCPRGLVYQVTHVIDICRFLRLIFNALNIYPFTCRSRMAV